MQATKAKETERTAGHSYAHVEAAIARVFGLQEADGKLKGRIQHMRRLGLTPFSDGGPVVYDSTDWPDQWIIGLELEYAGLDPITAVQFVQRRWRPHRDLQAAKAAARDKTGATLTDLVDVARAARGKGEAVMLIVIFTGTSNNPAIGYFSAGAVASRLFAQDLCDEDEPRRATVIPLTTRLRQLDRELGRSRTVEKETPGSLMESVQQALADRDPADTDIVALGKIALEAHKRLATDTTPPAKRRRTKR